MNRKDKRIREILKWEKKNLFKTSRFLSKGDPYLVIKREKKKNK